MICYECSLAGPIADVEIRTFVVISTGVSCHIESWRQVDTCHRGSSRAPQIHLEITCHLWEPDEISSYVPRMVTLSAEIWPRFVYAAINYSFNQKMIDLYQITSFFFILWQSRKYVFLCGKVACTIKVAAQPQHKTYSKIHYTTLIIIFRIRQISFLVS